MNLSRLEHGRIIVAEVRRADGGAFDHRLSRGVEVRIGRHAETGEITLRAPAALTPLRVDRPLLDCLERGLPRLAWVAGRGDGGAVLTVQIHSFARRIAPPEPLALGVDDKIAEDVRHQLGQPVTLHVVCAHLARWLLLPSDAAGRSRAIVTGGPDPEIERAFRLHGEGVTADIVWRDGVTRVRRLIFSTRGAEARPVALLEAPITFDDITRAGAFRGVARAALEQLADQRGSYFDIWQRYWQLDARRLVQRRRAFGVVPYDARERDAEGGWRFRIPAGLELADRLAPLGDAQPIWLDALAAVPRDWRTWLTAATADDSREDPREDEAGRAPDDEAIAALTASRGPRGFSGQLAHAERGRVVLTPRDHEEAAPPEAGVLLLSIAGDQTRLRRQREADHVLRSASGPMPQLGMILLGEAPEPSRHRRYDAITPVVREAFGGEPTPAQRRAIHAALNTPDVAIIQGPPGTGKTRTLAALQVRLAELDEAGAVKQALLSSYQHDAVEHAAGVVQVYGLPAVKVGRRRDTQHRRDHLDAWLAERERTARGHIERRPAAARLDDARRLAVTVMVAPRDAAEVRRHVEQIIALGAAHIAPALIDAVRDRLDATRDHAAVDALGPEQRRLYRRALWGLYDDPIAFADGGPRRALLALARLRTSGLLDDADRALLEAAARWRSDDPPQFLAALGALRDRLLDRLVPDHRGPADRLLDAELHRRLGAALDDWADRLARSPDGVAAILEDYADTLRDAPHEARAAVARYTRVLAATCQQSASRPMSDALGVEGSAGYRFDSVVIDEAARANPLDLLIPMAYAERRVVLVGDHRQLPHLLEPEIERDIEASVTDEEAAALRESLFERLFVILRDRERRDGQPRVVTLDQQFRMHPVLGDFVSDQFYPPGEGFGSPRPAADFAHDLPGLAGRCAAWLSEIGRAHV